MTDLYQILGISRNASQDEVRRQYRKLCKELHSDRNPGDPDADRKYKEVVNAYEILGDPLKRSSYDRGGQPTVNFRRSSPPPDFSSIVEEMFGGGSSFRGRSIQVRVEIELLDVLTGCKKTIRFKKRHKCGKCSGNGYTSATPCGACLGTGFRSTMDSPFLVQSVCETCEGRGVTKIAKCGDCVGGGFTPPKEETIEVPIPAGIASGMQVRIAGAGEEPQRNQGRPGDVMVVVVIKEHKLFRRDNKDLLLDIPVSYAQIALGDKVECPTLTGEKIIIEIPAGTHSHTKFRLKNKGLSGGDMVITVKVETPKNIDAEYRSVLEQLMEIERKNITPKRVKWENERQH